MFAPYRLHSEQLGDWNTPSLVPVCTRGSHLSAWACVAPLGKLNRQVFSVSRHLIVSQISIDHQELADCNYTKRDVVEMLKIK